MSSSDSRRWIVVTGPTGQQGGATARALVEHHSDKFRVRCICRDPGNALAKQLAADLGTLERQHVKKELQGRTWEIVQGDLMDKNSLLKHFDGAWGVFLVTTCEFHVPRSCAEELEGGLLSSTHPYLTTIHRGKSRLEAHEKRYGTADRRRSRC